MYKHDNKLDVQRLGSESVYTESEDFEARKMINNRPKVTLERSEKDRVERQPSRWFGIAALLVRALMNDFVGKENWNPELITLHG